MSQRKSKCVGEKVKGYMRERKVCGERASVWRENKTEGERGEKVKLHAKEEETVWGREGGEVGRREKLRMSGGETEEIKVEKNCSYQDKTERGRVSEKENERENAKDRQVDVTSQDPRCLEAPAMPFSKLTSSSR